VILIRHLFCQKEEQTIVYPLDPQSEVSISKISPIKDPSTAKLDETVLATESMDICIPFHILVFYFKNARSGLISECEKNFIDDLIVLSFNSLSIDSKFVCYLVNESDFIEILMTEITEAVQLLPDTLEPIDIMGNFDLCSQINSKSPLLLD
jgi:hypothetical protein